MNLERVDILMYHLLLSLLFRNLLLIVFFFLSLMYSLYESKSKGVRKKDVLESLSRFKDAVEGGDSPAHAFAKLEILSYPDYFIHPEDPLFTMSVFLRQYELLQRRVFLEEELKSGFLLVSFRMMLMKYIPLGFMFLLSFFFSFENGLFVKSGVALGFLITHYYAAHRVRSL